jgi:hypothetical protein
MSIVTTFIHVYWVEGEEYKRGYKMCRGVCFGGDVGRSSV